ncbi:hypothetical protein CR513_43088, partial [Mucuna pruriens]
MAEEYLESEVVFPDHHHPPPVHEGVVAPKREKDNCRGRRVASSLPMSIPERAVRQWGCGEEEEAEEEMTPPHEIMRRRVAGKMAFSVCTGNGRTLKGRDLSQVRNSILSSLFLWELLEQAAFNLGDSSRLVCLLLRAMFKCVRTAPTSGSLER